jgi:hypothetical protein
VFFKQDVGQNEVDLFQSHPGYFDSENCNARAMIDPA